MNLANAQTGLCFSACSSESSLLAERERERVRERERDEPYEINNVIKY